MGVRTLHIGRSWTQQAVWSPEQAFGTRNLIISLEAEDGNNASRMVLRVIFKLPLRPEA